MFEDELTLFNKKYDTKTRDYTYTRTYLTGVNIDEKKGVNVIKSGLETANTGTIYIPAEDVESEDKSYVDPKEFQKSSKTNIYTLQNGDIIVRGIIDFNIDNNNTVKVLRESYNSVYEIVSVDDKRKGGLLHWEVIFK